MSKMSIELLPSHPVFAVPSVVLCAAADDDSVALFWISSYMFSWRRRLSFISSIEQYRFGLAASASKFLFL